VAPLPTAADEQPAEESSREGLAFFQNSGLISRLAQPAAEPEEAFEPEQAPVAAVEAGREVSAASVEAQAGALSEEELTRIVEKVAATVIERLAGSVLERIAWEVVPDLAESMIKEEIRRITENA
jgi:hypothetical protein